MTRSALRVLLASLLAAPLPAWALYHQTSAPGRSELAPGRQRETVTATSPSPDASPVASPETRRGRLRRPQHAERLERVQGIVTGMTNKLTNLSQRLDRHLQNFERRINALQAAGHAITVETELAAARAEVADMQTAISDTINKINEIPDSETPRQTVQAVRSLVRGLRPQLREVRAAFLALTKAIRDDVRAGRRASPTPSPSPLTSPSPSPLTSPSPSPALAPL